MFYQNRVIMRMGMVKIGGRGKVVGIDKVEVTDHL